MQTDFLAQFNGDVSAMNEDQKALPSTWRPSSTQARSSEKFLTTEYAKLQERHADLMKQLKTTRDQRIKQIEGDNKNGFLSVIKELERRDQQEREGRQIELVKLAGKKEYVRLGRPQTFADGNADNPILSADTVDLGREDEPGVESDGD
jgi:hypothetical protein